jgi:hypothetical protein
MTFQNKNFNILHKPNNFVWSVSPKRFLSLLPFWGEGVGCKANWSVLCLVRPQTMRPSLFEIPTHIWNFGIELILVKSQSLFEVAWAHSKGYEKETFQVIEL